MKNRHLLIEFLYRKEVHRRCKKGEAIQENYRHIVSMCMDKIMKSRAQMKLKQRDMMGNRSTSVSSKQEMLLEAKRVRKAQLNEAIDQFSVP